MAPIKPALSVLLPGVLLALAGCAGAPMPEHGHHVVYLDQELRSAVLVTRPRVERFSAAGGVKVEVMLESVAREPVRVMVQVEAVDLERNGLGGATDWRTLTLAPGEKVQLPTTFAMAAAVDAIVRVRMPR